VPVHVTLVPWQTHREALQRVREQVFIIEQEVPRELEWDGEDDQAHHFIALNEAGQALGCARLLPSGQIGRMAVLKTCRGTGLGARLLDAAIDHAQALGMQRVFLHAQRHAEPFYRKAGFLPEGQEFLEAGIPHIGMSLALPIPFEPPPGTPPPVVRPVTDTEPDPPDALIRCAGEHDCRHGIVRCLGDPRRHLSILSQQLDHALLDDDAVVDAISGFARSGASTRIRVLISDSTLIVSRGHRLVELARRLDSRIEIRKVADGLDTGEASFITWDDRGFWLMPDFRQYLAVANRYDPVQARRLTEQFGQLWERSGSDPELRVLRL
jgi:predicted GNAT family N-acyltransferase